MVCWWVLGLFLVVCTKEVLGLIFWVLEAIFLCFFFFGCILWLFSVRFWVFFCADFLVFWLGFYVIAVGFFFLGFKYDLQRAIWWCLWGFFVVEFLGNLFRCLGVFCELFRKKMVRVGWDGVTEEKWERWEKRPEKETSTEEKKRN